MALSRSTQNSEKLNQAGFNSPPLISSLFINSLMLLTRHIYCEVYVHSHSRWKMSFNGRLKGKFISTLFHILACACNTDGSLGVSCDENGRCNCRPGVLGEKCDQCGENRFNLSAGCTRKHDLNLVQCYYLFLDSGINFPCAVQKYAKFANFTGLYFPHFPQLFATNFRNFDNLRIFFDAVAMN